MLQPNDNLDEKVKEFFEYPLQGNLYSPKPMPRMLFLDDRTKRIEAARKQYTQQYDVTFVHNAKECLRYLCKKGWDIVSLDHDLDGNDFQDPDEVTSGMEVVRYIEKTTKLIDSNAGSPEFWIHSSNIFAAQLMLDTLNSIGIKAYYRKFEYGDEIKFGDSTPSHKPEPVEDKWDWYGESKSMTQINKCKSCGRTKILNVQYQCHDCYKRELIQCG